MPDLWAWTSDQTRARTEAKEIIAASGADTPERLAKAEGISIGVTFREQAAWWIEHVQQRKRKPIAPATVESWQGALTHGFCRTLAMFPYSNVGNLALKGLVERMVKAASHLRRSTPTRRSSSRSWLLLLTRKVNNSFLANGTMNSSTCQWWTRASKTRPTSPAK